MARSKGISQYGSRGTSDSRQAEGFRRKAEAEVYEFIALGKQRLATFAHVVSAYVTSSGDKHVFQKLLDWFKETPVAEIRQADACAAALNPNAKASTINRQCISPIIKVIKHAEDTEMPGAVRSKTRRWKDVEPIVNPAPDKHIDQLLPYLDQRLAALIIMMTFTCSRKGEALRVDEGAIHDGYIQTTRKKNDEPRIVLAPNGWEYPWVGLRRHHHPRRRESPQTRPQGIGATLPRRT